MHATAKTVICLIGWLCCCNVATAQQPKSTARLDAQRLALSKEIRATAKDLASAQQQSESTTTYVATLQKQIAQRRALLDLIEEQLAYTNNSILRTGGVIAALRDDVKDLQTEYGQLVRYAYRQHKTGGKLRFLLAASSFNEAFRRWRYLQQYDAFRQRQSELIDLTQRSLSRKITRLEAQQVEKTALLAEEREQIAELKKEIKTKNRLIGKLKKSEQQIAATLRRKERSKARLDKEVENIIFSNRAKMRRDKRSLGRSSGKRRDTDMTEGSPAYKRLTRSFAKRKGKLPMPVYNGKIIGAFGRQEAAGTSGVYRSNKGIVIATRKGTVVKAVHAGQVIRVKYIVGQNYIIIVQHGNYYSTYTNVAEPKVTDGNRVESGQSLGEVYYNPNSKKAELTFGIYEGPKLVDPAEWVR